MMTGKERLLSVLRGELPDRVPFSPNVGQWFGAQQARGCLPAELAGCKDEIECMQRLGIDIFSRRLGNFIKTRTAKDVVVRQEELAPQGAGLPPARAMVVETPYGTLRGVHQFQPESHTDYEKEHLWKDFEGQYRAVRYWLEGSTSHFDAQAYARVAERVGDAGLVIVGAPQTPLKWVYNIAGPENGILWILEHETEMLELMAIHQQQQLALAREVAASEAVGMMSMDNLCSLLYSPAFFDKYCRSYYRGMGEILHAGGKFWFAHACGKVGRLKQQVAEVELDGLEGPPHAPLGDIDLADFRDSIPYPKHIVWGGMTCHEQEVFSDARERIRAHVRTLFERMRPFKRFVFSSACNTSIRTPFENLLYFREFCYEFGRN